MVSLDAAAAAAAAAAANAAAAVVGGGGAAWYVCSTMVNANRFGITKKIGITEKTKHVYVFVEEWRRRL